MVKIITQAGDVFMFKAEEILTLYRTEDGIHVTHPSGSSSFYKVGATRIIGKMGRHLRRNRPALLKKPLDVSSAPYEAPVLGFFNSRKQTHTKEHIEANLKFLQEGTLDPRFHIQDTSSDYSAESDEIPDPSRALHDVVETTAEVPTDTTELNFNSNEQPKKVTIIKLCDIQGTVDLRTCPDGSVVIDPCTSQESDSSGYVTEDDYLFSDKPTLLPPSAADMILMDHWYPHGKLVSKALRDLDPENIPGGFAPCARCAVLVNYLRLIDCQYCSVGFCSNECLRNCSLHGTNTCFLHKDRALDRWYSLEFQMGQYQLEWKELKKNWRENKTKNQTGRDWLDSLD